VLFFPVALAYAEDAAPGGIPGASGLMSMAPLIILFVIFYFLLIRPQQKRAKEHKEMLSKVAKGDNIITTGGIHGRVTSVNEDTLTVEIAENTRIKISKDSITARKAQG
jgi:preprotein translocase subunit YajC